MVLQKADDTENKEAHDRLYNSMEGISSRLKRIEQEGTGNSVPDED